MNNKIDPNAVPVEASVYEATTFTSDNDLILPVPVEVLQHLGWTVGDKIVFRVSESGEVVMAKG